jgi:hypothetical protein
MLQSTMKHKSYTSSPLSVLFHTPIRKRICKINDDSTQDMGRLPYSIDSDWAQLKTIPSHSMIRCSRGDLHNVNKVLSLPSCRLRA